MQRYLVQRLLLFIPTLFIVSLLSFFLSVSSPGDPMETGLSEMSTNRLSTEKLLRYRRHELGLDLPLFYFSLGSAADIDTINRISDKQEREALQALSRSSGRPREAAMFYSTVKKLQVLISSDTSDTNDYIAELLTATHQNRIGRILLILHNRYSVLTDPRAKLVDQAEGYLAFNFVSRPWMKYIPSLHWHGFRNQYHQWLMRVIRGDFGESYRSHEPVIKIIRTKFWWSFTLSLLSVILAYAVSIPLGVYSAWKRDSVFDRVSGVTVFALYALPNFLVGTMLLLLFSNPAVLNVFPSSGVQDPLLFNPDWNIFQKIAHWAPYLVLPLITYTVSSFAFLSRQVRTGILEISRQDYIRTAFAKGLSPAVVYWKHALRNTLIPLVTVLAYVFPLAISGSVIVETIFGIPGMGREIYEAVLNSDYPMIVAVFTIFGFLTMAGYLLSDILYAVADPRIRFEK